MEHESDGDLDKKKKKVRLETLPNYSIVEIDQNTEKSPGDLRGKILS